MEKTSLHADVAVPVPNELHGIPEWLIKGNCMDPSTLNLTGAENLNGCYLLLISLFVCTKRKHNKHKM